MNKKLVLTVLIVLATLTLAACAPRVATTSLSPEEGVAYATEVDEIVENLLVGFSENDYATLTRDWDSAFREKYDESAFYKHYDEIISAYGAYQSKTLDRVEDQRGQRIVTYHVVFENVPDVTVRLYFKANNPDHLIVGLYWED